MSVQESHATSDSDTLYGKRYRIFYPVHIRKSKSVSVPDSDTWYKMGPYPRGRMLVINNKRFLPCTGFDDKPREGSGCDVEALVNLFLKLGYVVEVFEDLQMHELMKVMENAASKCYKNYGAFVCALLTHGEEKHVYAVDGALEIREITKLFCRDNLAGIPKVFLIEAGRCTADYIARLDQSDGKLRREESLALEQRTLSLPEEADFLFAYSTVSGYNSWLNPMGGSWFIQALCMVLNAHARDMDLLRMLTKVNELVSRQRCLSSNVNTQEKEVATRRQVASVVSQLRKEFYFFPPSLAT